MNHQSIVTSITVPFVITPNDVYIGDVGFFFTPIMGRWKVAFNSGCVTCALLNLRPWNWQQHRLYICDRIS